MDDQENNRKEEAEIIRKKYLYRRLILQGKLRLPYDAAVKLIGQDSAYHLYTNGITNKKP